MRRGSLNFVLAALLFAATCVTLFRLKAGISVTHAKQASESLVSDLSDVSAVRAQLRLSPRRDDATGKWWDDTTRNPGRSRTKNSLSEADKAERSSRSIGGQIQEVVGTVRAASESLFASSIGHYVRAALVRQLAEREPDAGRRMSLFCEALSQYGRAIKRDSHNSRLLMNWANIRQTLGSYNCNAEFTVGDYRAVLQEAVRLDPTNVGIRYAAALVLSWGGESSEANKYLYQVLRFGTALSERQERFAFARVSDAASLRELIPPRFPQILRFSRFLGERQTVQISEGKELEFRSALANMQIEAIRESTEAYEHDKIPYDLHFGRLVDILPFVNSTAVRQTIDRHLSLLAGLHGEAPLAKYLLERSELKSMALVPATLASDTRPTRTPLVDWGWVGEIALDDFYRSIGLYLGEEQTPRILQITVPTRPSDVFLKSMRIFHSADNQNWTEITELVGVEFLTLGQTHLIVLRIPSTYQKYWKIHFAKAEREGLLDGSLPELIAAYGLTLAEEEF